MNSARQINRQTFYRNLPIGVIFLSGAEFSYRVDFSSCRVFGERVIFVIRRIEHGPIVSVGVGISMIRYIHIFWEHFGVIGRVVIFVVVAFRVRKVDNGVVRTDVDRMGGTVAGV